MKATVTFAEVDGVCLSEMDPNGGFAQIVRGNNQQNNGRIVVRHGDFARVMGSILTFNVETCTAVRVKLMGPGDSIHFVDKVEP